LQQAEAKKPGIPKKIEAKAPEEQQNIPGSDVLMHKPIQNKKTCEEAPECEIGKLHEQRSVKQILDRIAM
jgi:hypothetical protein